MGNVLNMKIGRSLIDYVEGVRQYLPFEGGWKSVDGLLNMDNGANFSLC
jgi:hypothetical protein